MTAVELSHGAATDVGLVREINEDSFLAVPPVFVVADGMGGHDRGDVASTIVVEEFARLADSGYDPTRGPDVVAATLGICRDRIAAYDAAQRAEGAPADFSAGTTAVIALLVEVAGEPRWLIANLGDSRAYRVTDAMLQQISVDHSLVQDLIDAGLLTPEEAITHPERHVITRALGGESSVEADFFELRLDEAGRLLLCTDGINGMLRDEQIAQVLGSVADAQEAADALVAAAIAAGGEDNATAVVVDVVGLSADQTPPP